MNTYIVETKSGRTLVDADEIALSFNEQAVWFRREGAAFLMIPVKELYYIKLKEETKDGKNSSHD